MRMDDATTGIVSPGTMLADSEIHSYLSMRVSDTLLVPQIHMVLQLILGVGAGGASLVKHVGGWTLNSIAGFSSAFSHNLQRSLESR